MWSVSPLWRPTARRTPPNDLLSLGRGSNSPSGVLWVRHCAEVRAATPAEGFFLRGPPAYF